MKTHILLSISCLRKLHLSWDNVEKYSGDWGATNDVTIWRIRVVCWISKTICTYTHAHAHAPGYPYARTHVQAYTHSPICNTYCFSTATMVSWTRLIVTLHAHCCLVLTTFQLQRVYACSFPTVGEGEWRISKAVEGTGRYFIRSENSRIFKNFEPCA
jgi:hypothetical protein